MFAKFESENNRIFLSGSTGSPRATPKAGGPLTTLPGKAAPPGPRVSTNLSAPGPGPAAGLAKYSSIF